MMTMTTYDVFAVYTHRDRRRKPITRYIAAVCTDGTETDHSIAFYEKAWKTMPRMAKCLSMMVSIPRDATGHAETMAKVNYWADPKNKVPA